MAKGRPPTPTPILKARGGYRADRHGERIDGAFPAGAPPCPRHLKGVARREWKRVMPDLLAAGVLARIDLVGLAAYCETWGRVVEIDKRIDAEGLIGEGNKIHPLLGTSLKLYDALRRFLIEFGFSPAARARVKPLAGTQVEEDDGRFFGESVG